MAYARRLGLPHFEVSAKTGENINRMFGGIIDTIVSVGHEPPEHTGLKTPAL